MTPPLATISTDDAQARALASTQGPGGPPGRDDSRPDLRAVLDARALAATRAREASLDVAATRAELRNATFTSGPRLKQAYDRAEIARFLAERDAVLLVVRLHAAGAFA